MSTAKQLLINRINTVSDDMEELEIIERLYMLARLEHSIHRCETEGTLTTDEVRNHFKNKREAYTKSDILQSLEALQLFP